ncbi:hypothetical protein [Streptomyces sp. NPDC050264]|uniref:hypothetical protein n=1 Tax=Streptomyces sp. NPDC050264 TaxID=3155038 RepID=UPI00342C3228
MHAGCRGLDHTSVVGGRGIGLALARQIARVRGGDVYLAEPGGPPPIPELRRTGSEPVSGGAVFVARLHDVMEAGT